VAINLREMQLTAGQVVGEQLDGATLTFTTLPQSAPVPCTHSPIIKDFVMENGQSSKTLVQACQFRVAAVDGFATDAELQKGLKCTLTTGIDQVQYGMQLWAGGLISGGAIYQFMLADESFRA
jgi:hypothetical protein